MDKYFDIKNNNGKTIKDMINDGMMNNIPNLKNIIKNTSHDKESPKDKFSLIKCNNFLRCKISKVMEECLYFIGIIIIAIGTIDTIIMKIKYINKHKDLNEHILTTMRIYMSEYLTLSLTFFLGAEIIKTFRVPNFYQLFKVFALIILKELITFFLDRNLIFLKKFQRDLIDDHEDINK